MMIGNPLVSIVTVTYNHEPFIVQTLEGFLMQKTNFNFEIVIGEDCSSDRTRQICFEYQKKYPDKIKLIVSDFNVGPHKNFMRTLQSAHGKYIALCEGDDYWVDLNKLQKQVDFLENNQEYSICFHTVSVLKNGKIERDYMREVLETTGLKELSHGNYIHTLSVVYRNNLFDKFPEEYNLSPIGDYFLHVLNAGYGKIKKFPEIMGVYRIHDSNAWVNLNIIEILDKTLTCFELILQAVKNNALYLVFIEVNTKKVKHLRKLLKILIFLLPDKSFRRYALSEVVKLVIKFAIRRNLLFAFKK